MKDTKGGDVMPIMRSVFFLLTERSLKTSRKLKEKKSMTRARVFLLPKEVWLSLVIFTLFLSSYLG